MLISLVLFILLRLLFLTRLPIFNDEAIYLHWAYGLNRNFLSLWQPVVISGLRQPGTIQLISLVRWLPLDPLVVGRLLSVLFSLVTFFAVLALAKKLKPTPSPILTGLLLALCPYLVFYDRMAIAESAIIAITSLTMLITFRFIEIEKPTINQGMLLGLILSMGFWIKSNALLLVPTVFLSLAMDYLRGNRNAILVRSIAFLATFFALTLPQLALGQVTDVTAAAAIPLSQLSHLPIGLWIGNVSAIFQWLFVYLTPFTFIMALVGARFWKQKSVQVLLVFFLLPLALEIFFTRVSASRYIATSIPPVMLLAALGISGLGRYTKPLFAVTVATSAAASLLLMLSPLSPLGFFNFAKIFPKVRDDFGQYVTGWSSGWGVREVAMYLTEEATKHPIVVFVRADSGNPEDAMYVYLRGDPKIVVVPLTRANLKHARQTPDQTYYFVSRGPQYAGLTEKITELKRFPKPLDNEFVGIYKLNL